MVGTPRRECLDRLIVLTGRHLRAALAEFVACYNLERPHRTPGLETPQPTVRASTGPIRSRAILRGLHDAYQRAA